VLVFLAFENFDVGGLSILRRDLSRDSVERGILGGMELLD